MVYICGLYKYIIVNDRKVPLLLLPLWILSPPPRGFSRDQGEKTSVQMAREFQPNVDERGVSCQKLKTRYCFLMYRLVFLKNTGHVRVCK